jgi:hypothetical protein
MASLASVELGYHGHDHKASSTDADVKLAREKEGRCGECGNHTHELKKSGGFLKSSIAKIPLTNQFGMNGVCLICRSSISDKSHKGLPVTDASENKFAGESQPKKDVHQFKSSILIPAGQYIADDAKYYWEKLFDTKRIYRDASLIILDNGVVELSTLYAIDLMFLEAPTVSEVQICLFRPVSSDIRSRSIEAAFSGMTLISKISVPVDVSHRSIQRINLSQNQIEVAAGCYVGIQVEHGGLNLAMDDVSDSIDSWIWKYEAPFLQGIGGVVDLNGRRRKRTVGFMPIFKNDWMCMLR